jgi:aspartate carbamoyltransferase regulatory subunit
MHSANNIKELNIGLQDAAQQLTEIEGYVKCRNEQNVTEQSEI